MDAARVIPVPPQRNRFSDPWYVPPRVRHRSLAESRNRILYSPLREAASDGIGHAFGTMNAEVGAALRLGLAYTHRVASYGSLTRNDSDRFAVENFFGWGIGETERTRVRETFCSSSYDGFHMSCQPCESVTGNKTWPPVDIQRVVEIPMNLTYKRRRCSETDPEEFKMQCVQEVRDFVQEHNETNTIFQMPVESCGNSPVDRLIDPRTKSFFFHKYWDLHSKPKGNASNTMESVPSKPRMIIDDQLQGKSDGILRRRVLKFREDSLVIAVHARRGDFFEVKRDMISCRSFGVTIRQLMKIVHEHGGVFSKLPVSVYIYSEGKAKPGFTRVGHDVRLMTRDFVDSDGVVREAEWIEQVIRGSGEHQNKDGGSGSDGRSDVDLFKNGLEVNLRIASDTLESMHEMIAADVFIGSNSALGKFVVSTLSRGGLHLFPIRAVPQPNDWRCCVAPLIPQSGDLLRPEHAREFWGAYADANEESVRRAWRSNRRRRRRDPI